MKKLIFNTLLFYFIFLSVSSAQNYIIFFAYPPNNTSVGGHAYAAFITKDEINKQTILDGKWGFHPSKQSFMAIFKEDGIIKDEWGTIGKSGTLDFVVEIKDVKVYELCKDLKDTWNCKNYSVIGKQTCVGFIRDIASKIPEIEIPKVIGTAFPKEFLINLRNANKSLDEESRKSLSQTAILNQTTFELPKEAIKLPNNDNIVVKDWIGGSTPEELGKILLKALKTNDQKTWAKTVLPIEKDIENDNNNYKAWADWHAIKRFELIRDGLEGAGVTNWNLVEFSRVIYSPSKLSDGSKSAQNPVVEFTYKNKEFVGTFNLVIFYSKNGKFYVPGFDIVSVEWHSDGDKYECHKKF